VHKEAHIQHRCRTKCQGATGLLLPSSPLSHPATVKKKQSRGGAGSGDGVTGRGCFLLGKID